MYSITLYIGTNNCLYVVFNECIRLMFFIHMSKGLMQKILEISIKYNKK